MNSTIVSIFSGFIGGFLSSLIFYPLDTIEARQQIDPQMKGKNLLSMVSFIMKTEGLFGFYIGWQPGIFGVAINWSIYFLLYECGFPILYMLFSNSLIIDIDTNQSKITDNSLLYDFSRGIFAGIFTSIIVNPFWVVKSQMINKYIKNKLSKNNKKKLHPIKPYDLTKWIIHKYGFSQLFSGVYPSMFGCVHSSLQFILYHEFMKSVFFNSFFILKTNNSNSFSIVAFFAGALSNLIATTLTYPYQTIRIHCQISNNTNNNNSSSLIYIVKNMYKDGKLAIFYNGLSTNLIRQVPTSGVLLCTTEFINHWLLSKS